MPPVAPLVKAAYNAPKPRYVIAATGEEVLLRGGNMLLTASAAGKDRPIAAGVNFMRLVLNWNVLEPVAPTGSGSTFSSYVTSLDQPTLDTIDALARKYANAGIYMQLDFHQSGGQSSFFGGSGIPSWFYTDGRFAGGDYTTGQNSLANADWWAQSVKFTRNRQLYLNFLEEFITWAQGQDWYEYVAGYQLWNEPNAGSLGSPPYSQSTTVRTQTMATWLNGVVDFVHGLDPARIKWVMPRGGTRGFGTFDPAWYGGTLSMQQRNMALEWHAYYTGLAPGAGAHVSGQVGLDLPGDDYYPDDIVTHNTAYTGSGQGYHGTKANQAAFLNVGVAKAAACGVPLLHGEMGVQFNDPGRLSYIAHMTSLLDDLGLSALVWKFGVPPNDDLGITNSDGTLNDMGQAWSNWWKATDFTPGAGQPTDTPPAVHVAPQVLQPAPHVGDLVDADDGLWDGNPAPTLTRQWQNADPTGSTGDPDVTLPTAAQAQTPGFYDPNQNPSGAESVKQLGRVDAIIEHNGVVYVGGNFSTIVDGDGSTILQSYIAAYNKATRRIIKTFKPPVSARVRDMDIAVQNGVAKLWIGHGDGLTVVNALSGVNDPSTGAVVAPVWTIDGEVRSVDVHPTFAFIGGAFSQFGSAARDKLAKVVLSGGNWNVDSANFGSALGSGGRVYKARAKSDGSRVAATGDFPGGYKILNGTTGASIYNLGFSVSGTQHGISMAADDDRVAYGGDFGPNIVKVTDWNGTDLWNHQCDGNIQALALGLIGQTPVLYAGHHGGVAATHKNSASPTETAVGFFVMPWSDAGGDLHSYGNPPGFGQNGGSTPLKVWALRQSVDSFDLYVGGDFTGLSGEAANTHRRFARFPATVVGSGGGSPTWDDIVGETDPTYLVDSGDLGKLLRVVVTADNDAGSATLASAPTVAVAAQPSPALPVNTSRPTLSPSSAPVVGVPITVDSGAWSGASSLAYGFQRRTPDGSVTTVKPAGAGQSYTPVTADTPQGTQLRAFVIGTNSQGTFTAYSDWTGSATTVPPAQTNPPTVTPTAPQVGQQVTLDRGTYSDATTVTSEWELDQVPTGNTTRFYTPVTADIGKKLRGRVTATGPGGTITVFSAETSAIVAANPSTPVNDTPPSIVGPNPPHVGDTLTRVAGTWEASPTLTYQWQRESGSGYTNISGETGTSYVVQDADLGLHLRVVETGTISGNSLSVPSARVDPVAAGAPSPWSVLSVTPEPDSIVNALPIVFRIRLSPLPTAVEAKLGDQAYVPFALQGQDWVGSLTPDDPTPGVLSVRFRPTGGSTSVDAAAFWGCTGQEIASTIQAAADSIGRPFVANRFNQNMTHASTGGQAAAFDAGRYLNFRNANWQTDAPKLAIPWDEVAAGLHDDLIDALGAAILADPRWTDTNPYLYSPHHEMTVNTVNQTGLGAVAGNTKQAYIDQFRRVRTRWDAAGVTRKKADGTPNGGVCDFCYVPYIGMWMDPTPDATLDEMDPDLGSSPAPGGTSYYEYGGGDVYNKVVGGHLRYGTDAAAVFDPIHDYFAAVGKRMVIPELGVSDGPDQVNHDEKAAFIASMADVLEAYGDGPGSVFMLCWTLGASGLYQFDSSPESLAAAQDMGNRAYFSAGLPVVPITPVPPPAPDTILTSFDYTASQGFGTTGDNHTFLNKSGDKTQISVDGDEGVFDFTAANTKYEVIDPTELNWSDVVDFHFAWKYDTAPLGGQIQCRALWGYTDNDNLYKFVIAVKPTGNDTVQLFRRDAAVDTTLSGPTDVGIDAFDPDTYYHVRVQMDSDGSIRIRWWDGTVTEPGTWNVTATDPVSPPRAGSIGVGFQVTSGVTSLPLEVRYGILEGSGTPS